MIGGRHFYSSVRSPSFLAQKNLFSNNYSISVSSDRILENGIEDSCIRLRKFAQVKPLRCGGSHATCFMPLNPSTAVAPRCRKWRGRAARATFRKI
ncbi:hypothetical protein [Nostoc sp.]